MYSISDPKGAGFTYLKKRDVNKCFHIWLIFHTYCSMMPGSGFLGRERSRVPRGVIGRERFDKLLTLEKKLSIKFSQKCETAYLEVHVVPILILQLLCWEVSPLQVRYTPPVYMVARDDMVCSVDVDDLVRRWI